jgi:hypothetical protein
MATITYEKQITALLRPYRYRHCFAALRVSASGNSRQLPATTQLGRYRREADMKA